MSRFPQLENRGRGTWRVWWGPDEPAFDDYATRLEAQRAIQDFREYVARQERQAERWATDEGEGPPPGDPYWEA